MITFLKKKTLRSKCLPFFSFDGVYRLKRDYTFHIEGEDMEEEVM